MIAQEGMSSLNGFTRTYLFIEVTVSHKTATIAKFLLFYKKFSLQSGRVLSLVESTHDDLASIHKSFRFIRVLPTDIEFRMLG